MSTKKEKSNIHIIGDVLQPLISPDISIKALYRAFIAAYSYDIRESTEKLNTDIVIMLGENELYAKKSILLLEEKSLKPIKVREFSKKGHAEILSKEAIIISQQIKEMIES